MRYRHMACAPIELTEDALLPDEHLRHVVAALPSREESERFGGSSRISKPPSRSFSGIRSASADADSRGEKS